MANRRSALTRSGSRRNRNRLRRNRLFGQDNSPTVNKRRYKINLNTLRNKLPQSLQGLIEGKTPRDIHRIEARFSLKGFNTTTWRDEGGTNLYLNNLSTDGGIEFEQKRATLINMRALFTANHRRNRADSQPAITPPDTIIIKINNSVKGKIEARQMIADLLESASNEKRSYILNESPATLLDQNQIALAFRIKAVDTVEPIMKVEQFKKLIGPEPSGELEKLILTELEMFHQNLAEIERTTHDIENGRQSKFNIIKGRYKEMFTAANQVVETIKSYVEQRRTTPVAEGTEAENQQKIKAAVQLQNQLAFSSRENFVGELDSLRQSRWQSLNPLSEEQIIPGTRFKIGEGAQGDVFAATILLNTGEEFNAALKLDDNDLNDVAVDVGIPRDNPQQSVRAVAAYRLNKALGLNIIPRSDFMVQKDENGRSRLGYALEVVNGDVGQKKGRGKDQLRVTKAKDIQDFNGYKAIIDSGEPEEQLAKAKDKLKNFVYKEDEQQWYQTTELVEKISDDEDEAYGYQSALTQQQLADLQLFDAIIGAADRHPGNYILEKDTDGHVIGIKGIDNDESFGKSWQPYPPKDQFDITSKTPGVPPIVDFHMALKILKLNELTLGALLAGLSEIEQNIARARLSNVQETVKDRVRNGQLAATEKLDLGVALELFNLAGMGGKISQLKIWGEDTIGSHDANNSYLGHILDRIAKEGVYPDHA